jgi:serine protease Do/serine protease DegQ
MQDITPELAQAFDINENAGAVVTRVLEGSAADEAGLQVGDVITAIDGDRLINADSLRNTIGLLVVGQTIQLDIIRDGKTKALKAKVKETKKQTHKGPVHPKLSGATFGDIEESSPYYGKVEGIMVYSVKRGSAAWYAGLRQDDIITSVNKQHIKNLEDFKPLAHNGKALLLNITRRNRAMFLLLK